MVITEDAQTGSTRSVYDALWARFLDGSYTAGDRLPEATLAAELGVSRTPVREALGRMLAEGLVAHATRGVVVAGLDHAAMRRLFDLRRVLEGFAADLTAQHVHAGLIAPIWFQNLRAAADAFDAAVADRDAAAATRSNRLFHELIVEASGNEFLADAHRRAIARLAVSTALNLERSDWAEEAARQHHALVDAIAEGDVETARSLAETHIHDATHVFEDIG